VPVQDTLKRVSAQGDVAQTVPRRDLWQAYTPQMFRLGLLADALSDALNRDRLVTDDASALELAGYQPQMVEGHAGNIKITRPADLALAAFYLSHPAS
jgi:2-C-methyl-D-erythritol 4-phosphate cytidylyltransferase